MKKLIVLCMLAILSNACTKTDNNLSSLEKKVELIHSQIDSLKNQLENEKTRNRVILLHKNLANPNVRPIDLFFESAGFWKNPVSDIFVDCSLKCGLERAAIWKKCEQVSSDPARFEACKQQMMDISLRCQMECSENIRMPY